MAWINRFKNLFRGRCVDSEIDEELCFHIEARVNDNIAAGMTAEEARRDAMRRFGGHLQTREAAHDANIFTGLATIGQDIRYAIRGLRKNPGVTAIAVLSLGLAIGANTAIFSIVDAVLLRALPYQDSGRIVMLWTSNALNNSLEQNTSVPNMEDWKARTHTFQDLAAYRESDGPVMSDRASGDAEWTRYDWITANFFDLLGRSPVLGRVIGGQEFTSRARVAVLSHEFWQRRFGGSQGVLGKVLNAAGIDFEIIGVMPSDFRFPTKKVQFWLPAGLSSVWQKSEANRGSRFGAVFGRLKHGADIDQARAEMRLIAANLAKQYPEANQNLGVNLVPLQVQINGGSVPFMLAILFGAVMFVLLIACANVANLLLARGVVRSREIALRVALGAGRTRIVRQLLTESVLLSCLAGCLSLPLVAWSTPALLSLAPANIERLAEVHIDIQVLLFSFALSLISGALFGLAPAIRISRADCADSLRGNTRNSAAGRSMRVMRAAFVVCQFAVAVILLTGAGLLIRSLLAIGSVDPGFGDRDVLTASLRFDSALPPPRRVALFKEGMERIRHLPGVRTVGTIRTMFWDDGGGKFGLRAVEGRPSEAPGQWSAMTWTSISGEYFQAVGVPLLRGRFFSDQDSEDSPPVVLINETMARRFWPGQDPLGKRIKGFDARGKHDDWVTVIGVVKDVHSGGLERAPMAQIFESQSQSHDGADNLVISASGGAGLTPLIRNTIRELDRSAILSDVSTIDRRLEDMTAQRRFQTDLLGGFAALALALAGAGIFGMMHHSVAQRTQEIGIRMALGARRSSVLAMLLREGMALAAVGVGLGIAGALMLMRTISSLLFGVTPEDPLTFAGVALTLTAVALVGCYVPGLRATKVDPIIALRCD